MSARRTSHAEIQKQEEIKDEFEELDEEFEALVDETEEIDDTDGDIVVNDNDIMDQQEELNLLFSSLVTNLGGFLVDMGNILRFPQQRMPRHADAGLDIFKANRTKVKKKEAIPYLDEILEKINTWLEQEKAKPRPQRDPKFKSVLDVKRQLDKIRAGINICTMTGVESAIKDIKTLLKKKLPFGKPDDLLFLQEWLELIRIKNAWYRVWRDKRGLIRKKLKRKFILESITDDKGKVIKKQICVVNITDNKKMKCWDVHKNWRDQFLQGTVDDLNAKFNKCDFPGKSDLELLKKTLKKDPAK